MKRKQQYKFNADYFNSYFTAISNFTHSRNTELENWFYGMFRYVDSFMPLRDGRERSAIEFGCASGAAASVLSSWGWNVTATDVHDYPIKKAKSLYKDRGITFKTHDIQVPYGARIKRFDLAYCFDVIEHLEDPERAIRNMKRIVKKGGYVVCSTPNDQANVYDDPSHINVRPPSYWHGVFKKVGFSKVTLRQVSIVPYLYKFHRRLTVILPIAIASPHIVSPMFIVAKV